MNNRTTQLYQLICGFCGHSWKAYFNESACESCGNTSVKGRPIPTPEPKDQIDIWIMLGRANPWIAGAYDPPFTRNSFYQCKTVEELKEKFKFANWCLGQAFYYKDICFINQVNGGGEWLTIRYNIPFESITMSLVMKNGEFESLIERLLTATKMQCERCEY